MSKNEKNLLILQLHERVSRDILYPGVLLGGVHFDRNGNLTDYGKLGKERFSEIDCVS